MKRTHNDICEDCQRQSRDIIECEFCGGRVCFECAAHHGETSTGVVKCPAIASVYAT